MGHGWFLLCTSVLDLNGVQRVAVYLWSGCHVIMSYDLEFLEHGGLPYTKEDGALLAWAAWGFIPTVVDCG